MNPPNKTLDRFWEIPLHDLLDLLKAAPEGLSACGAFPMTEHLSGAIPHHL